MYGIGAAMAIGAIAFMAGASGKKNSTKRKLKKTANKAISTVGDILDNVRD